MGLDGRSGTPATPECKRRLQFLQPKSRFVLAIQPESQRLCFLCGRAERTYPQQLYRRALRRASPSGENAGLRTGIYFPQQPFHCRRKSLLYGLYRPTGAERKSKRHRRGNGGKRKRQLPYGYRTLFGRPHHRLVTLGSQRNMEQEPDQELYRLYERL